MVCSVDAYGGGADGYLTVSNRTRINQVYDSGYRHPALPRPVALTKFFQPREAGCRGAGFFCLGFGLHGAIRTKQTLALRFRQICFLIWQAVD